MSSSRSRSRVGIIGTKVPLDLPIDSRRLRLPFSRSFMSNSFSGSLWGLTSTSSTSSMKKSLHMMEGGDCSFDTSVSRGRFQENSSFFISLDRSIFYFFVNLGWKISVLISSSSSENMTMWCYSLYSLILLSSWPCLCFLLASFLARSFCVTSLLLSDSQMISFPSFIRMDLQILGFCFFLNPPKLSGSGVLQLTLFLIMGVDMLGSCSSGCYYYYFYYYNQGVSFFYLLQRQGGAIILACLAKEVNIMVEPSSMSSSWNLLSMSSFLPLCTKTRLSSKLIMPLRHLPITSCGQTCSVRGCNSSNPQSQGVMVIISLFLRAFCLL